MQFTHLQIKWRPCIVNKSKFKRIMFKDNSSKSRPKLSDRVLQQTGDLECV